MTHAYDEICLDRAADNLGRMLDYSAYSLHYDIAAMIDLFIASGTAALFEHGDIRITAGMSGVELAYEILEKSGVTFERTQPRHTKSLSAEYWCGYALARIQWKSCTPFNHIMQAFSAQSFLAEYGKKRLAYLDNLPLDISEETRKEKIKAFGISTANDAATQFMTSFIAGQSKESAPTHIAYRLKELRLKNGLSQSELAKASGIPVRTIQQYEQGQKDLAKARAEYLIALARALNCEPAFLLSM